MISLHIQLPSSCFLLIQIPVFISPETETLRTSLHRVFVPQAGYWQKPTGLPVLPLQAQPAKRGQGRLSNLFPSTIADRVNMHHVQPLCQLDQLEPRQAFEQSGSELFLAIFPGKPHMCVGGYAFVSLYS
jgi:hypothetical protein